MPATNQGLYNGFLAVGLIRGPVSGLLPVRLFFLACVLAAEIFRGFTAGHRILYIQFFRQE